MGIAGAAAVSDMLYYSGSVADIPVASLLLPRQSREFAGRQFHIFSDFQDAGFLCLDNLCSSGFTAAHSGNGAVRLFLQFQVCPTINI